MSDEEVAQARIAELGQQIKNEKQFRKILLTAQLHLRKAVYEQIKPHLKFECQEYRKLMRYAR